MRVPLHPLVLSLWLAASACATSGPAPLAGIAPGWKYDSALVATGGSAMVVSGHPAGQRGRSRHPAPGRQRGGRRRRGGVRPCGGASRSRQPGRRRLPGGANPRWPGAHPRLPGDGTGRRDPRHVRRCGGRVLRPEHHRAPLRRRSRERGGPGGGAGAAGATLARAGHRAGHSAGARRVHRGRIPEPIDRGGQRAARRLSRLASGLPAGRPSARGEQRAAPARSGDHAGGGAGPRRGRVLRRAGGGPHRGRDAARRRPDHATTTSGATGPSGGTRSGSATPAIPSSACRPPRPAASPWARS